MQLNKRDYNMSQDERRMKKYNEVMDFMAKNHRKLSKYHSKEKLMFHFIHHNKNCITVGS